MKKRCRRLAVCLSALLLPVFAGCSMLHELQPHRLKRMNHGVDGMPASDYSYLNDTPATSASYFASISDPIEAVSARRVPNE